MERLTNSSTKEAKNNVTIRQICDKLSEFEDLEDLIGIPLKELAELFQKNIPKDCKNPKKAIILTDEDVDKWKEYKNVPCKENDIVYKIVNQRDNFDDRTYKIVSAVRFNLSMLKEIGKTIFLTKEKANQKLEKDNSH